MKENHLHPSRLLPPEHIVLDLDRANKKRVFEHVGLILENTIGVARLQVFNNLFERERLGSTGVGGGYAIPHGRVPLLRRPVCAFVRTKKPIPFEAPDREPVRNLFFLLAPEDGTQGSHSPDHQKILSMLSEMIEDKELMAKLDACQEPEEVHDLISSWHGERAEIEETAAPKSANGNHRG